MKLKLVLESSYAPARDVVVTCDATATVGDVARRLDVLRDVLAELQR